MHKWIWVTWVNTINPQIFPHSLLDADISDFERVSSQFFSFSQHCVIIPISVFNPAKFIWFNCWQAGKKPVGQVLCCFVFMQLGRVCVSRQYDFMSSVHFSTIKHFVDSSKHVDCSLIIPLCLLWPLDGILWAPWLSQERAQNWIEVKLSCSRLLPNVTVVISGPEDSPLKGPECQTFFRSPHIVPGWYYHRHCNAKAEQSYTWCSPSSYCRDIIEKRKKPKWFICHNPAKLNKSTNPTNRWEHNLLDRG